MGFQVPNAFKVSPTEGEQLFKQSWDVIKDEVLRLTAQGWAYSERGKSDAANKSYQGANIYFYFVYLAQAARYKLELLGTVGTDCNSIAIDEQYGFSCIEQNLPCLSTHFNTSYKKAWDQIMTIFGIDRDIKNCDQTTPITPDLITGEFKLGEFKIGEFTNFNE